MINDISFQIPKIITSGNGARHLQDNAANVKSSTQNTELSEEQQAEVDRLKKADQEIRAHEAAHKNAGGGNMQAAHHIPIQ